MTSKPEDFLMQAWKRQCDAGLGALEAIIEGATKIHETQLQAAAEAHADAEATRKAITAATDPSQLFKLQAEWARANAQKSLAYWRSVYQALAETGAAVAKCAGGAAPVTVPETAGLNLIDSAYRQWLEAAQRFYRPVEKVSA